MAGRMDMKSTPGVRPGPTFSICIVSRETPRIVERFVEFHAALGPETITVIHDGMARDLWDQGLTLSDRAAACTVIVGAEDDIWPVIGFSKPESFVPQQEALFTYAYQQTTSDWIFCMDADEFLMADKPVQDMLAAIPANIPSLILENVEAVWGPGDTIGPAFSSTWFRRQMPEGRETADRLKAVHGHAARLLNAKGFVGYIQGKSVHRRGAGIDYVAAHWGEIGGEIVSRPAAQALGQSETLRVAHFDAISFARWRDKFAHRRRVSIGDRRRLILRRVINTAVRLGYGPTLFRMLYSLNRKQIDALGPDVVFQRDIFAPTEAMSERKSA